MAEKEPELLDLTERVHLIEDAPFWGSVLDTEEIGKLADEWLSNTSTSQSVRQIVLESWLLVDFWIRMLIAGGLGITKFNTPDLDLRYAALPDGFERCLNLLQRLRTHHAALPTPVHRRGLTASMSFWSWASKNHKDVMDAVMAVEEEYNDARGLKKPNIYGATSIAPIKLLERQPEKMASHWLETVVRLDDDWFNACRRLNSARNLAAHSTDVRRIAASFGIAGDNALELVRGECNRLVEVLTGMVPRLSSETTP